MSDTEVVRLTNLLSAAVKFSNTTQREVERKIGLSSGSLSRLFSGGIELKTKHILDICTAIGFPPSCFFRAAYSHHREQQLGPNVSRIERLLNQLHPDASNESFAEQAAPTPNPSPADIERMVAAAMGKFFAGLGNSAPANGAS